jgi:hypothetical protein
VAVKVCMTYMSEAVPLGSALCIHSIEIIVSDILYQFFDLMFEDFTAKSRLLRAVKW